MIKLERRFNQEVYALKIKLYDLKIKLYDYRNNAIMKGKTGLLGNDIYSLISGYLNKAMYTIGPSFEEKYYGKIPFNEVEKIINNFEISRHKSDKKLDSFDLAAILLLSISKSNIIENKKDKNLLALTTALVTLDPPFINHKGMNLRMSTGSYFNDSEEINREEYSEFIEYLGDLSSKKITSFDEEMLSNMLYTLYMNKVTVDKKELSFDLNKNVKIKKK